jgi:hypothetical protein
MVVFLVVNEQKKFQGQPEFRDEQYIVAEADCEQVDITSSLNAPLDSCFKRNSDDDLYIWMIHNLHKVSPYNINCCWARNRSNELKEIKNFTTTYQYVDRVEHFHRVATFVSGVALILDDIEYKKMMNENVSAKDTIELFKSSAPERLVEKGKRRE